MVPHIKHRNLWFSPSGCSDPENLTGPDTHTSLGVALSSFQLLESPAGSLLALTPDCGSFSSAPAGLFPPDVEHRHEQEQTLRMQHLLKSLFPPGGAESISTCPLKAQSPLFNTLNHQGSTGTCTNLHTPSSGQSSHGYKVWHENFKTAMFSWHENFKTAMFLLFLKVCGVQATSKQYWTLIFWKKKLVLLYSKPQTHN